MTNYRKAGIDGQPIQPRLESSRIPQVRQLSPRGDEGFLDGIAGELRVANDEPCRRAQPDDGRAREDGERVVVAALRSLDKAAIVHRSPRSGARRPLSQGMSPPDGRSFHSDLAALSS